MDYSKRVKPLDFPGQKSQAGFVKVVYNIDKALSLTLKCCPPMAMLWYQTSALVNILCSFLADL